MKLIPLAGRGNEYLYKPDGSQIIWVSRAKKGFPRKQNSLGTENTLEARKRRDEKFVEWFGERPKLSNKIKLLNDYHWPIWILTKSSLSHATKDSVKYAGQHLVPVIGNLYPDELTETWWLNSYVPMQKVKRGNCKFFNEWKWLSTYLNFLHREGIIERLPKLKNPDGPSEEGLNLEDDEINVFYRNANDDLQLQIDLGFEHFMRRSEVLLMPWSEIDFKKRCIELPPERTKIRKKRTVPLNDRVLVKLKTRKAASKSPFVFPSPKDQNKPVGRLGNQSAWENAIARANGEGPVIRHEATFHDLRHSGLTRAFKATNRYLEICVMAGLDLKVALKVYVHLDAENTRFVSDLVSSNPTTVSTYDHQ